MLGIVFLDASPESCQGQKTGHKHLSPSCSLLIYQHERRKYSVLSGGDKVIPHLSGFSGGRLLVSAYREVTDDAPKPQRCIHSLRI